MITSHNDGVHGDRMVTMVLMMNLHRVNSATPIKSQDLTNESLTSGNECTKYAGLYTEWTESKQQRPNHMD